MGNFITSNYGLKITHHIGFVGSTLVLGFLLLASFLITTNFFFFRFFKTCWVGIHKRYIGRKGTSAATAHKREAVSQKTGGKVSRESLFKKTREPIRIFSPGAFEETGSEQASESPEISIDESIESPVVADYVLPPLSLLNDPPVVQSKMSAEEILEISELLEKTLADFDIEARVVQVTQGPVVTLFALQPAPGVKINRIVSLENDLAMVLRAISVRILAPIPGKAAVGIEVPNRKVTDVYLKEILTCEKMQKSRSPLAFGLGKTIAGEPYICDLTGMPHLLIAGATGSGKSVCLNAIIASILFRQPPDRVKFIIIDPKRVEMGAYRAIPHLLAPVVCDTKKSAAALAWAVEQMEQRYHTLAEDGVRNIDSYNALALSKKPHEKLMGKEVKYMPHVIIVIDELADLMMIARADVEEYVIRLAQLSRAVGIHLVIATQRPSVNVITGIIKANFPSRIAFQVSSKVDSRTILDMNGAETLLGRGDMLFSHAGAPRPIRIQGTFVAEEEVEALTDYIREQQKALYVKEDFEAIQRDKKEQKAKSRVAIEELYESEGDDELYQRALRLVLENKKASVSLIQRRLKVGYARAGRLMDMMEETGIVGPYQGSKPRALLVDPAEELARMGIRIPEPEPEAESITDEESA